MVSYHQHRRTVSWWGFKSQAAIARSSNSWHCCHSRDHSVVRVSRNTRRFTSYKSILHLYDALGTFVHSEVSQDGQTRSKDWNDLHRTTRVTLTPYELITYILQEKLPRNSLRYGICNNKLFCFLVSWSDGAPEWFRAAGKKSALLFPRAYIREKRFSPEDIFYIFVLSLLFLTILLYAENRE